MPDKPKVEESPTHTKTGEVIREGGRVVRMVAGLEPGQMLILACAFTIAFICGVLGWTMYDQREERREERKERQENAGSSLRESNSQHELLRQHCERESASLRAYFSEREKERNRHQADLTERQLKHEADQAEKWRQVMLAVAVEQAKWREILGPLLKKMPNGILEPIQRDDKKQSSTVTQ